MSALSELKVEESSAALDPSLLKSILSEVAWKLFDNYSHLSVSFKVLKVIPVTITLGSLKSLWIQVFGPEPIAS